MVLLLRRTLVHSATSSQKSISIFEIMGKKPIYQIVLEILYWIVIGLVAGGILLDAISNAINLINLKLAISLTIIIILSYLFSFFLIRSKKIKWKTKSGEIVTLTKFSRRINLQILGVILLLWIPIFINLANPKGNYSPPTINSSIVVPVFKSSDTRFKMLVLPFDKEGVLEGKSYNIGIIISRRLESLNLEDSLNLTTNFLSESIDIKNLNATIADSIMQYHHADQIIYGSYSVDDKEGNKVNFNYRTNSVINLFRKKTKTDYIMMSFSDSSIRNGAGQEDIDFIIYSRAAVAAMFKGNFQRSILLFKKIKNYLDFEEISYSLAECYHQLNKFNEAKLVLEKAVERNLKSSLLWNCLGVTYLALNKKENARKCYERAIEANDKDDLPWYNLGNHYRRLNNYTKAIECYQNAINKNPRNNYAWANLGHMYYLQKNYPQSEISMNRALEIDAQDTTALVGLSLIYLHENKFFDAKFFLEKIISISPRNAPALANLSRVYIELQDFMKGKEFAERSLSIDSTRFAAWNSLGIFYLNAKDYKKASECFQMGLKFKPSDAGLTINLNIANSYLKNIQGFHK